MKIFFSCLALLFLLGCVSAQTDDNPRLGTVTRTFLYQFPTCTTGTSSNNTSICALEGTPLECTSLLDRENERELISLTHGRGLAFYQTRLTSGNATLVARSAVTCSSLEVAGEWRNWAIVSSHKDDDPACAVGLGLININQIISTVDSLTTVDITADTTLFSFADHILWSLKHQLLLVFGGQKADGTSEDFILQVDRTVSAGTSAQPTWRTRFRGQFPFKFVAEKAILFEEGDDLDDLDDPVVDDDIDALWIVGPVASTSTGNDTDSSRVEIWSLLPHLDGTGSDDPAGTITPSLVSSIATTGAKFVAVGEEDEDILFIAQRDSSTSDKLTVVDISNLRSPQVAAELTYQRLKSAAGSAVSSSSSGFQITAMTTEDEDMWLGWNTGELFVFELDDDLVESNLELEAFTNAFTLAGGGQGSTSSASSTQGVTNICVSRSGLADLDDERAFLTAFREGDDLGNLFLGVNIDELEL